MSLLFGDAFPFSHRVAVYLEGIGIMDDTIADLVTTEQTSASMLRVTYDLTENDLGNPSLLLV